jgi:hypothetical protein
VLRANRSQRAPLDPPKRTAKPSKGRRPRAAGPPSPSGRRRGGPGGRPRSRPCRGVDPAVIFSPFAMTSIRWGTIGCRTAGVDPADVLATKLLPSLRALSGPWARCNALERLQPGPGP